MGFPVRYLDRSLMSAKTLINDTGDGGIDVGPARDITIYIKASNATVSAGAVQIEEADDPAFTGTWSAVGSPVTLVQNTQVAVHLPGEYKALRTRISTAVTGGGTASTRIVAGM